MEQRKTIELLKIESNDGVTIYQNEETGLKSFKTSKSGDAFVACPDDKSLFSDIVVYPKVVVCILPKDALGNNGYSRYRYRVYVRSFNMWLTNPEILPVANEPKNRRQLNFFDIIEVHYNYLHIACEDNNAANRVYVFKAKKWVAIPSFSYDDMEDVEVINFESAKHTHLHGQECLLLTSSLKAFNPYSIYFIGDDKLLSIPHLVPYKGLGPNRNYIFRKVFESYVVIALGSNKPEKFYAYRFDIQSYMLGYIGKRNPEMETIDNDWYDFGHELFTADHIAITVDGANWIHPNDKDNVGESEFVIISTKDWQKVSLIVSYTRPEDKVVRPKLVDGKLTFSVPLPILAEQTIS